MTGNAQVQNPMNFDIFGVGGAKALMLFASFLLFLRLSTKRHAKLPPGNLGFPLIGEMVEFMSDPFIFLFARVKRYGTIFLTHVFLSPTVMVCEDEDVKWLWSTELKGETKVNWPEHWQTLMGRGSVSVASGKHHRSLRRMFEPAFSPGGTRDYVSVIDETVQTELAKWASSGTFHPSEEFKLFALRLFFFSAMGKDYISEKDLQEISHDFGVWLASFMALIPYPLPCTAMGRGMAARNRLASKLKTIVAEFKEQNPPDSERGQESLMGRLCYGKDETGKCLSDDDLVANILVIMFAGHDTTYASMGTLLHHLNCNRTVHEALVKEIDGLSSTKNEGCNLDFDELKQAPILNATIAESWRVDPPVGFGGKVALKDLSLEKYTIPKGYVVCYSIFYGGHNPKHYTEPTSFQIERFLPPNHPYVTAVTAKYHAKGIDYNATNSSAYRTFGGGSHGCLGSHFAKLEMRIFLTRLLQHYKLDVINSKRNTMPFLFWRNDFKLTPRQGQSTVVGK